MRLTKREKDPCLYERLFKLGLSLNVNTIIVILVEAGLGGVFSEEVFPFKLLED